MTLLTKSDGDPLYAEEVNCFSRMRTIVIPKVDINANDTYTRKFFVEGLTSKSKVRLYLYFSTPPNNVSISINGNQVLTGINDDVINEDITSFITTSVVNELSITSDTTLTFYGEIYITCED